MVSGTAEVADRVAGAEERGVEPLRAKTLFDRAALALAAVSVDVCGFVDVSLTLLLVGPEAIGAHLLVPSH